MWRINWYDDHAFFLSKISTIQITDSFIKEKKAMETNGCSDSSTTTQAQLLPKGLPFDNYQPPNWDEFFMLKVYLTGEKSSALLFLDCKFCDYEYEVQWKFSKIDLYLAKKSKDPRTKIGAVLVRDRRDLISGFNGIPEGKSTVSYFSCYQYSTGVEDRPDRFERPIKYMFFEHAERNAIFTAARHGISTDGATLYVQALPCVDCAR
jgi:tRNA(Arg) A34 adenosine deaminase TadA